MALLQQLPKALERIVMDYKDDLDCWEAAYDNAPGVVDSYAERWQYMCGQMFIPVEVSGRISATFRVQIEIRDSVWQELKWGHHMPSWQPEHIDLVKKVVCSAIRVWAKRWNDLYGYKKWNKPVPWGPWV